MRHENGLLFILLVMAIKYLIYFIIKKPPLFGTQLLVFIYFYNSSFSLPEILLTHLPWDVVMAVGDAIKIYRKT